MRNPPQVGRTNLGELEAHGQRIAEVIATAKATHRNTRCSMLHPSKRVVLMLALSLVSTSLVVVPQVRAEISCGQTITSSSVLTGDLTCSGSEITMGASSITLNCREHRITGAGILVQGFQNVTVQNCIVQVNGDPILFLDTGKNTVVNCTLTSGGGNYGVHLIHSNLNSFINNSGSMPPRTIHLWETKLSKTLRGGSF